MGLVLVSSCTHSLPQWSGSDSDSDSDGDIKSYEGSDNGMERSNSDRQ
jgi:hypothetical protein